MIRGFSPLMTVIVFVVLWVGGYILLRYVAPRLTETRMKALTASLAFAVTTFFIVLFLFFFVSLTK